ncbi:MAG: hypothetical protein R3247_01765 [Rhodothermales bacterium]|nr:hypothetical protein [Rhodothermales bacterium]
MRPKKPFNIVAIVAVVSLLILGFVFVRSCHSTEDPQHFRDDDVTAVMLLPDPAG